MHSGPLQKGGGGAEPQGAPWPKDRKKGGNAIPPSEAEADLRLIVRHALSGGYAVMNNSFILSYENKRRSHPRGAVVGVCPTMD